MRSELFNYLVALKHDLYYLGRYKISVRRFCDVYSGFLLIASAASVASWSIWNSYAGTWATITIAAQILQLIKPLIPMERQRQALIYITQDEEKLFDELEDYWYKVGRYDPPRASDDEIQDKILDFKRRRKEIVERFAPDIDFPDKANLKSKAKSDNRQYFWYYHNVRIEEENTYVEK